MSLVYGSYEHVLFHIRTLSRFLTAALKNLSVESDAPYLGKNPLETDALIKKIASLRNEDYPTLKLAIRRNIKCFLQPCATDPNTWADVFKMAADFKRKPTDLSVVTRNVQFHTKTRPALKWSKN